MVGIRYWLAALLTLVYAPAVFAAGLEATSIGCTEDVLVGSPVTCQATIENQGTSTETINSVTLHLDENWAGDQIQYANINILPDSEVEASSSVTVTFEDIEPTLAGGEHTFSSITGQPAIEVSGLTYPQVNVVDATQHVDIDGPADAASGEQFTVTATVTAQGSIEGVYFSLTITSGSCTIVDDSVKNLGNITSGTTKFVSWTLQQGTSGDCGYKALFIKNATAGSVSNIGGASASATTSFSGGTTTTTGPVGGGPPGPTIVSITATVKDGKAIATFTSISEGVTVRISIPDSADVPFSEIEISALNEAKNVKLTVYRLSEKPGDIAENIKGEVYSYIQIDKENIEDADIDSIKIAFKVPLSWITDNNIDKENVVLNRYADGTWNALTTTKSSEDSDYVHYSATSPGLSVFGISGQVAGEAPTAPPITTAAPATMAPVAPLAAAPLKRPSSGKIIPAALAIAIIGGAIYYFYRKRD